MTQQSPQDHEQTGGWTTVGRSASSPGEELPDEQIRQDVCDRLMQLGPVDCVSIGVTVNSGIVTLDGTIYSHAAAEQVESVVKNVAGVRGIENNLRV